MKKSMSFMLVMFILILLASCSSDSLINENVNDTDTSMEMSYDKFTGTRTKTIALEANTVVTVNVVTNGGKLDLSVTNESGRKPYTGNSIRTNQFTFKISEDGEYMIKINGNSHNGSYKVSW